MKLYLAKQNRVRDVREAGAGVWTSALPGVTRPGAGRARCYELLPLAFAARAVCAHPAFRAPEPSVHARARGAAPSLGVGPSGSCCVSRLVTKKDAQLLHRCGPEQTLRSAQVAYSKLLKEPAHLRYRLPGCVTLPHNNGCDFPGKSGRSKRRLVNENMARKRAFYFNFFNVIYF